MENLQFQKIVEAVHTSVQRKKLPGVNGVAVELFQVIKIESMKNPHENISTNMVNETYLINWKCSRYIFQSQSGNVQYIFQQQHTLQKRSAKTAGTIG